MSMAVTDPAAAADDNVGDRTSASVPPPGACPVLDDDDASSPLVPSDSSRALDDAPLLPTPASAIKMPATVDSDLLLFSLFFCKAHKIKNEMDRAA